MEAEKLEKEVLVFEYDLYLNYERLYNLKIFKQAEDIWFDITYEGFFYNVPESVQAKVNKLFDGVTTKGELRELPLKIYKLIVPPKYEPEKVFIFKVYDWINQQTGVILM